MKTENKVSGMLGKIAGVVFTLVFFSYFMSTAVFAADEKDATQDAAVVSSRTADDGIFLYIKGVKDIIDGSTVQVGNTLCKDVQMADVVSMGMPIRTTILFDNSLSLSKRWGSQAKKLVTALIDNHAEGEEFRIATFSDDLNIVFDFSTEYDSIKNAVEKIEFFDQESFLTDILYNLLKQSSDSHEANYTRFIIIADGADDKDIKYTQVELADLMKGSGVVIHTVGVKASKNGAFLENLFSYARLTGGTYNIAESSTDIEDVRDIIDEDHSLLCLRLIPEADIMDGGRKEAKLDLNTSDGMIMLTVSLQMPFADVGNLPSASPEPSKEPSATPVPMPSDTKKQELPSIAAKPQTEEKKGAGKADIMPAIMIAAGIFVVAIILVVLLVFLMKKKKPVDVIESHEQPEDGMPECTVQGDISRQSGSNTVRLGEQINQGKGATLRLQDEIGRNAVRQSFITLTDISNPKRSFRAPIDIKVVIGRKTGDIILGDDETVSHAHCEIIKRGNLFYVKDGSGDRKSSNGTFYGGTRVYNETPIISGGILEVGRCKYKVMIEN